MELISKNLVLRCFDAWSQDLNKDYPETVAILNCIKKEVKDFPTTEQKHGHKVRLVFEDDDIYLYQCSECGHYEYFRYNFCPHCGATMVEVE